MKCVAVGWGSSRRLQRRGCQEYFTPKKKIKKRPKSKKKGIFKKKKKKERGENVVIDWGLGGSFWKSCAFAEKCREKGVFGTAVGDVKRWHIRMEEAEAAPWFYLSRSFHVQPISPPSHVFYLWALPKSWPWWHISLCDLRGWHIALWGHLCPTGATLEWALHESLQQLRTETVYLIEIWKFPFARRIS